MWLDVAQLAKWRCLLKQLTCIKYSKNADWKQFFNTPCICQVNHGHTEGMISLLWHWMNGMIVNTVCSCYTKNGKKCAHQDLTCDGWDRKCEIVNSTYWSTFQWYLSILLEKNWAHTCTFESRNFKQLYHWKGHWSNPSRGGQQSAWSSAALSVSYRQTQRGVTTEIDQLASVCSLQKHAWGKEFWKFFKICKSGDWVSFLWLSTR